MFRKKVGAGLLILSLSLGMFTACGTSTTENVTNENATATSEETTPVAESSSTNDSTVAEETIEPTTITYWHAMTGQQETTLKEITDEFNKENEYGITVELVGQGNYSDLSTKLTANAAADTLPDMAQAYNSWLMPYLDKVVHLDDFVSNDFDNYDDVIQGYRDECSEFGFINALPFNKSTYVYFYNKTLFDELGLEAPKTWEDMMTIGQKFKEEKNMITVGYDDMPGMLQVSLKQNGTDYVAKEGALFDTDAGKETVSYILDLYRNGYARLVGEDGYFSGPMSNQQVASYVGSSAGVSFIDTSSGWELGVAALPGNKENAANQAGTNLVMLAKDANNQKATWEYMKFITSQDATIKWAMETGYLPIRTSAYESDTYQEFMKSDLTATAAYAQSSSFLTSATFDKSSDVQTAVNNELENLILEGTDNDTAFTELVDTINNAVK